MKRQTVLLGVIILMFGVLIFLMAQLPSKISFPADAGKTWTEKDQSEYVDILLAKGLKRPAAAALEEYISQARLSRTESAKVCYRLGKVYLDLYEDEKALEFFYRAEMMGVPEEFKEEMGRLIVQALEKLGMSAQSQYELNSRTSLTEPGETKTGEILARIGEEKITVSEIDQALEKLPAGIKERYKTGEGRQNFIKEYVARTVLYRKAGRLGIDRNPRIRQLTDDFQKQVVIEQLVKDEIDKKLKVTAQDLEAYYQANKDRYSDAAKIKVSYVKFNDPSEKEAAEEKLKKGEGTAVEGSVSEQQADIPGIGAGTEIVAALFLKEKGAFTESLKINDSFYIFSIDDKQPRLEKPYDQVKAQVESTYTIAKQQEILDSLVKETFQEQQVEIFYDLPKDEQTAQEQEVKE